ESKQMSNLTAEWDLIPDAPTCNGDSVYFAAAVGVDTQLFRMPAAGGRVEQLTRGDRALGGFSFSQAFDRMAFTASRVVHPAEAFAAKIDGSGERQLSALNDAWLKEVEAVSAERIHFPSKD